MIAAISFRVRVIAGSSALEQPAVLNAPVITAPMFMPGGFESGQACGSSTSPSSGSVGVVARSVSPITCADMGTGLCESSADGPADARPKNLAIRYDDEIPTSRRKGPTVPH